MKPRAEIEEMVMAMPQTVKDYPFGEDVAVYKIDSSEGKMFALIQENSMPVRLSLKCDPQLAELLRDKYETVIPGFHLNKKHWNTVICSGQLGDNEIQDLIRHSYELVASTSSENLNEL
ncbi:MmcQ/YjbR family DNA-binding protein [Candidatus Saccharibacteria bacterium]|nr:MmcQ/YjbR family DNA-binding protein [Candidatus Saccharibacteria bacterium]NCU40758.1 MmcQ/YjbR family DNA-binding protein [Candidatus Saccharibacteria bacterium]